MPNPHGQGLPGYTLDYNLKGRSINYRPEKSRVIPILIDSTSRDTGNTGNTSTLRAGLPMSQVRVTTEARYLKWMPTNVEAAVGTSADADIGLGICEGILATDCNLKGPDGVERDTIGYLLVEGTILESDIKVDYTPVTSGTAPSIQEVLEDFGYRRGVFASTASTSAYDRPAYGTIIVGTTIGPTCETLITVLPGATVL